MPGRSGWVELRTALTGIDPGLVRLHLAGIAVAAMLLATGLMTAVRQSTGQPITIVLISGVLAMFSNLAVMEPDLGRRRVTTAVMLVPALASVAAGTLLAPHRVVADAVFVVIMGVAVWIRRYGPRGNAIGMAAFIAYFFTQFLAAQVGELPWLMLAAAAGITSTLLLRGFVFAENSDVTLRRLERAFLSHVHGLLDAAVELLEAETDELPHAARLLARRRTRLNETALLVADQLERSRRAATRVPVPTTARAAPADRVPAGGDGPGREQPVDTVRAEADDDIGRDELRIIDIELSTERLAVAVRRLVEDGPSADARRTLVAGLRSLGAATAIGVAGGLVPTLLDSARRGVAGLVADTEGLGDRTQRVAFAVSRLADALGEHPDAGDLDPPDGAHAPAEAEAPTPDQHRLVQPGARDTVDADTDNADTADADTANTAMTNAAETDAGTTDAGTTDAGTRRTRGIEQYTRQAVQVAVATSAAIVVGELISPARWYWAVIAAFVVFAGTTSRGDILARGSQRVVGTIGGVAAGMALAFVVDGSVLPALVLLFVCVFLALYLVQVSQALMAFWITAVLALLYGLTGQFSVATLVLRIEETAAGAALGMAAGYLILPTGTRVAFGRALDDLLAAVHVVLDAAAAQLTGQPVVTPPVVLARAMDVALGTLRARAKPLDNPLPRRRGRSSYQRALRVFTAVDHYARRLARLSDAAQDPGWTATLEPALARIDVNLDGLVALLDHRDGPAVASAEDEVDAAEAQAARTPDARLRGELLMAARLIRRIDQAVVGFATDLQAS